MKRTWMFLLILLLPSCRETTSQPQSQPPTSQITAYVHWDDQALAGKQIQLMETGVFKETDSTGTATFSVPAGKYTVRAYGINRGGPTYQSIDFIVEVKQGEKTTVDIVDCLPCL